MDNTKEKTVYEIRMDGRTICTSSIPMCGYRREVLRQIVAAGFLYCVNGKVQRKNE